MRVNLQVNQGMGEQFKTYSEQLNDYTRRALTEVGKYSISEAPNKAN